MAGLIPGLGKFDDLGYTVSKFGAVSFTRYCVEEFSYVIKIESFLVIWIHQPINL